MRTRHRQRSRQAIADTTLSGCPFGKGETVIPVVATANRDPSRYERPDEVNLERETPHDHRRSISARTSASVRHWRSEMNEAAYALRERMPDMRLDPSAQQPGMMSWLMRTYKPLHVVFAPGRKVA